MSAPSPALVVSLHDVSPHTWEPCWQILAELRELGVTKTSLLVIPDHHRRGHFLQDAGFAKWLQEQSEAEHEIVIHGYYHQRAQQSAEDWQTRMTTQVYTAGEGEFFDITNEAATRLLEQAREEFSRLGLHPQGFIAPAWLLSAEGEQALRQAGMEYTTRLAHVLDLQQGWTHRSQSLVWSVRARWRRVISRGWNASLNRRLRSNALARLSIHPVDIAHPAIWRQIKTLTSDLLTTREPLTYLAWVEQQRGLKSLAGSGTVTESSPSAP